MNAKEYSKLVASPDYQREPNRLPSAMYPGPQEKKNLSINSSVEEIEDFTELLSNLISDVLWNKVFYHSSFNGPAVTTTSSGEVFTGATRESDTSAGKFLSLNNPGKFRCHAYFNSTNSLITDAYIGSFGASNTDTGITSINQTGVEHLAFFFDNGDIKISGRNQYGSVTKNTGLRIEDDTTFKLEIDYSPRERADFYYNDEFVGSITEYMPTYIDNATMFALMVSNKRTTSSNTTVTVETWEFIQQR